MSSLCQYKIKTFWEKQIANKTANSCSMYFRTFQKWAQYRPMVPFTRNVKKIKGAAHKSGHVDGTCKQSFRAKA